MGKIQDALDKLRDESEDSASVQGGPSNVATPAGSMPYHAGAPTRSRELQALSAPPVPRYEKKIDIARLKEFGLVPKHSDGDDLAQQFRRIKRPIVRVAFDRGAADEDLHANVIMLASALSGSGKSFCAYNLAKSIARERDHGVLLMDADVLKPTISRALGLEGQKGLIDFLLDPDVGLEDILVATNDSDILLIPAGQRHDEATELLASRRMQELIHTISRVFSSHAILLDTPPLLVTNEARVLAERVGQIAFVIEAGISTQDSVLQALDLLDQNKPINAILNKSRSEQYGDYGFGYHDYYEAPQQD